MRLVTGRWVTDNEPTPVLVFNEALGTSQPSATRIRSSALPATGYELATVVGVVADLRYSRLDSGPVPEAFVDLSHGALFGVTALARTDENPTSIAQPAVREISAIDSTQSVFEVSTLEQALSDSTAPNRLNLYLLTTFASVAVLLVLIGTYGVVSYVVAQRTSEIGIRIALGAQRARKWSPGSCDWACRWS